MSWKRILLFSILFLVLVVGLFYYVLPNVLHPLRIDQVPAGAYTMPWMKPSPAINQLLTTFNIDTVMADALKLNITFRINMWDNTTRVIPSTVYLGHDQDYLYVGGKFVGMGSNPASDPNPPHSTEPNVFRILFDVANTGVLKTPEAGSGLAVNIRVSQEDPLGDLIASSWCDMMWVYDAIQYKCMAWMQADNYLWPNSAHTYSMGDHACGYDNSTGTVKMLFSRFLRRPGTEDISALQMRPGERFVMGFLLELEYQKPLDHRVDGWPQKTFGIWSNDSSWWPKMAIDLTNPPSNVSST